MQYQTDSATGRIIYRRHNDFGPLGWRELKKVLPKIADLGLATWLDGDKPEGKEGKEESRIHPIQPGHYRAPEKFR